MRIAALIVVPALAALTGVAARSAPAPPSTVSCESIVLLRGSAEDGERRVVLGVVSVPPSYLPQVVPRRVERWRHWAKAGLAIRGGSPSVSVSVPKPWRTRVRIGWGDAGGSSLRFAPCPAYESDRPLRDRPALPGVDSPAMVGEGRAPADVRFAWRADATDDELVALTRSYGGRAQPGWWDRIRPHSLGWVTARSDDRTLIGFVNVAWDGGDHAFLIDTKVHPDHQRRGIGTELVRIAVRHAKEAGCEWMEVDFDEPLAPFYYDACGFVATPAGLLHLPDIPRA